MVKICSKCGVEKPLPEFQWRKDHNAPRADCKACCKIRADAYRAAHLGEHSARTRKWAQANPDRARAATAAWRKANIERSRANARAWQRAHPETARAYRLVHAAEIRARTKRWVAANREKARNYSREWARKNRVAERERSRKWYAANPQWSAAKTQWRQAQKLRATPCWANREEMQKFYAEAAQLTRATGIEWQVDHIVPLKSPLVSGLHVQNNLRVIPAAVNIAKSNRYWPDMPGERL